MCVCLRNKTEKKIKTRTEAVQRNVWQRDNYGEDSDDWCERAKYASYAIS